MAAVIVNIQLSGTDSWKRVPVKESEYAMLAWSRTVPSEFRTLSRNAVTGRRFSEK